MTKLFHFLGLRGILSIASVSDTDTLLDTHIRAKLCFARYFFDNEKALGSMVLNSNVEVHLQRNGLKNSNILKN